MANEQKEQMIEAIQEVLKKEFWDLKYMNFIIAFCEYMDSNGIEIDEDDIEEGERKTFHEGNYKKTQSTLKLKKYGLSVTINAYLDGEWLFEFEEVTVLTDTVDPDRIVTMNNEACVLFVVNYASNGIRTYAIPVGIAESLQIPYLDNEETEQDSELLAAIEAYEISHYIVHNFD